MAYAVADVAKKSSGRVYIRAAAAKETYTALAKSTAIATITGDGFIEIGENFQENFVFETSAGDSFPTLRANDKLTSETITFHVESYGTSGANWTALTGTYKNKQCDIVYLDLDRLEIRCLWDAQLKIFDSVKGGDIPRYILDAVKMPPEVTSDHYESNTITNS